MATPREDLKVKIQYKNNKFMKQLKRIKKDDLLYLAGFIDADGSIIAQIVRNKEYILKFQIRVTVQVTQLKKRRFFLEDIKEMIGVGTVRDRNEISDYVLTDTKLVCEFLKQIVPYLRLKKKQANLVVKIIEQLPTARQTKESFIQLCSLVDQVSNLNDSKSKKITADVVAKELLLEE